MIKKWKKTIAGCVFLFAGILVTGCSGWEEERMVNEMVFDLRGISELAVTYDEDMILFYEGRGEKLVVREYMTENKRRYYADTDMENSRIHISEGKRPFFKAGFTCRVEVWLPASYDRDLTVITTDGEIDMSQLKLNLDTLRAETTSGRIRLEQVEASRLEFASTRGSLDLGRICAGDIKIHTTEGMVKISRLEGKVNYTTTHGSLEVDEAVGSGGYHTSNDGLLQIRYVKADGDLQLYNKNGDIRLTLPPALGFHLEAVSKNGSVAADFGMEEKAEKGWIKGTNGDSPYVKIRLESRNGNLIIKKG
nr:DUF4097 family beta strand repeat-containing protein [uncultured Eisenbergiella sp.]